MNAICKNRLEQALVHMAGITVYRNILNDEIVKKYSELIKLLYESDAAEGYADAGQLLHCYHEVLSMLILRYGEYHQITGDLWKMHIIRLLLSDENPFSLACERAEENDLPEGLLSIVKMDLIHVQFLFHLDGNNLQTILKSKVSIDTLPTWVLRAYSNISPKEYAENSTIHAEFDIVNRLFCSENWECEIDALKAHYYQHGCGIFSQYKAFRWNQTEAYGCLAGIEKPDPIRLSQLIGYERERSIVIKNTMQFIHGLPCNNVLLYGDRGTGKSAAVKAILNEYAECRLRLIEVSKYHLKSLPLIMEALQKRGLRFILFIDDLSFESDETSYRELKSILEGGIEAKPENVVIYATSNRRHLIKEYFSERSLSDEVSSQDTMQEKLSLSDRFGITITFSLPDKETYLQIVEGLAKQRSLDIDVTALRAEALKWEMQYNGRSPRTARQFIDDLEGELKLKNRYNPFTYPLSDQSWFFILSCSSIVMVRMVPCLKPYGKENSLSERTNFPSLMLSPIKGTYPCPAPGTP
jgi:predicted AAA+ superfamily ATPase